MFGLIMQWRHCEVGRPVPPTNDYLTIYLVLLILSKLEIVGSVKPTLPDTSQRTAVSAGVNADIVKSVDLFLISSFPLFTTYYEALVSEG